MKADLQSRARALGFDDCRVTTAAAPQTAKAFEDWLANEKHGEMAWLQRNSFKRIDPARVLMEARSIVTLAVSYSGKKTSEKVGSIPEKPAALWSAASIAAFTLAEDASKEKRPLSISKRPSGKNESGDARRTPKGLVARYARYADYHDVLVEPLKRLVAFIDEKAPGSKSLWYVDTGPFLERDLAQRAGLGFVGKHTNLISRTLGNWFFLAEIITTAKIDPDEPEKNRCGSCARCLAACPTEAIVGPFQLDARRCISYLTIELKGAIPVELRPKISNRIYGCDDCLAVCPWNRFAREGQLMKEHAREDLEQPNLVELLALDDAGFKARFAGTPMLRTKRRGILRNVCVALGNVGDRAALPALERATNDPEPLIAEHARWAIEQIELRGQQKRVSEF